MAILGSSNRWKDFISDEEFIAKILEMVVDTWSSFDKPLSNDLELHITKNFRSRLEQHRNLKSLPVRIDREVIIDDPTTAEELGRIDLRFTKSSEVRSDVYFAFECKRLNVCRKNGKIRSLADKYVSEGMMRFVGKSLQYAHGLKEGGMIGYIMDGKVETAVESVDINIKKHLTELQMQPTTGLKSSSKISSIYVKETLHLLPDRQFIIHHVFLPI